MSYLGKVKLTPCVKHVKNYGYLPNLSPTKPPTTLRFSLFVQKTYFPSRCAVLVVKLQYDSFVGGQRPEMKIQTQIHEVDKGGQREDRGQVRLVVGREAGGQRPRQLINTPGRPTAQAFDIFL